MKALSVRIQQVVSVKYREYQVRIFFINIIYNENIIIIDIDITDMR